MSGHASWPQILEDREQAGRLLANRLTRFRKDRPVVLALPRGGVPIGYEIARELDAPLDVLIVRKIGAPDFPEYGLGALAEPDVLLLDEQRIRSGGYRRADLAPVIARERDELRRRVTAYRGDRPPVAIEGRTVILVDDGVATGGTMRAAIRTLRTRGPSRVIVALGVAPPEAVESLRAEADEVVVLSVPRSFSAIGEWYRDFDQVSDAEVQQLLRGWNPRAPPSITVAA